MSLTLSQLGEELEASKANAADLKQKLEDAEGVKEALEAKMKKMREQTDQWRKAADATAVVLVGGVVEMHRRIPDRCGSMDKHFGGIFQPMAEWYDGFVGSPGIADDLDDGCRSGKHKVSGIRMFDDLWKKKRLKQNS